MDSTIYKIIRKIEDVLIVFLKFYCGDFAFYQTEKAEKRKPASSSFSKKIKPIKLNFGFLNIFKKIDLSIHSFHLKYSFALVVVFSAIVLLSFKYSTLSAQESVNQKSTILLNEVDCNRSIESKTAIMLQKNKEVFLNISSSPREKLIIPEVNPNNFQYDSDKIVIDISSLVSSN